MSETSSRLSVAGVMKSSLQREAPRKTLCSMSDRLKRRHGPSMEGELSGAAWGGMQHRQLATRESIAEVCYC